MIAKRAIYATIAALVLGLGAISQAKPEQYPARVIRIIAPYTPGSPNDVLVRLLAQRMQTSLGQPIIIDNRPGGGTSIGIKAAAIASPDGYTLLFVSSSLVIDPALHKKTDYDPLKDFASIAAVATSPWILAVAPEVPARSVQEFIAHVKANPGKLSFGFAQGTASQLVGEWFKVLHGLDIVSVPYKGGALALPDLLAGRIQMLLPTPATVLQHIQEGKLRPLAITSATRSVDLPAVPTMSESGMPQLTLDFWAGMLAPVGTPPEVINKLNTAINESLQSPAMKTSMKKFGFEAKIGSPQDFANFIGEEQPKWANIVKSSGVKAD